MYKLKINCLFIKAEYSWFKVANGDLTIEEIHELQFGIKEEKQKINKKHLLNNHLPKKDKLEQKADISVEEYFEEYRNK